jgi:hypothetical protein
VRALREALGRAGAPSGVPRAPKTRGGSAA